MCDHESVTIYWKAVKKYFTVVLFFHFTQFVILENVFPVAASRHNITHSGKFG